jgi:tetratricopeptide (TPR) repeat protein
MRPATSLSTPATPVVVPSAAPAPFETLDNAGKLRRAEQLAEHRNFDDAIRIVDALVARNPNDAEYLAMRAWLDYQTLTANEPPKALNDLIERALRLDEQQPRALYLKGLVLKRVGKHQEAQRLFQQTLEADPHHLDAQRELRLAKMRK